MQDCLFDVVNKSLGHLFYCILKSFCYLLAPLSLAAIVYSMNIQLVNHAPINTGKSGTKLAGPLYLDELDGRPVLLQESMSTVLLRCNLRSAVQYYHARLNIELL